MKFSPNLFNRFFKFYLMTCIKKWVKVSVDFLEKFVLLKVKHFGLLVGQWDKGGFWARKCNGSKKKFKIFSFYFFKILCDGTHSRGSKSDIFLFFSITLIMSKYLFGQFWVLNWYFIFMASFLCFTVLVFGGFIFTSYLMFERFCGFWTYTQDFCQDKVH